ncbi:hypothetical protein [Microbacterium karelineae]|uniref:hypothetical protein n=1 Tax=Microbacterium karelineae TaxID=2654283 RepID=UPI0012EAA8DC|nr:hypothetical protein [Microbacterium karelineae]
MAMTPEEKRKRDRERKARYRAVKREKAQLEALPQIGPDTTSKRGTDRGTSAGTNDDNVALTNEQAARAVIADLEIPATAAWRAALVMQLARDLDVPGAIPQRAGLAQRYAENLEALIAAAKPREKDELDDMRRAFYTGRTSGIDDDPEARGRKTRKKA